MIKEINMDKIDLEQLAEKLQRILKVNKEYIEEHIYKGFFRLLETMTQDIVEYFENNIDYFNKNEVEIEAEIEHWIDENVSNETYSLLDYLNFWSWLIAYATDEIMDMKMNTNAPDPPREFYDGMRNVSLNRKI